MPCEPMRPSDPDPAPSLFQLALRDGVPRRSLVTALVVGAILTAINQGDVILSGQVPNLLKTSLNFLVPYCVASYGAASAKRAALRTQPGRNGREI